MNPKKYWFKCNNTLDPIINVFNGNAFYRPEKINENCERSNERVVCYWYSKSENLKELEGIYL